MEWLALYSTVFVVITVGVTLGYDSYRILMKDNTGVRDHRKDHILIYSVFASGYVWFLWTFMFHNGLQHSVDIHLVKEGMAYGLVLMNIGIMMLFKHLYMELPHG